MCESTKDGRKKTIERNQGEGVVRGELRLCQGRPPAGLQDGRACEQVFLGRGEVG